MSSGKIEFGDYLHQLRTAKGFSQKIVADKLGIDISMLSKIEHGERQVQEHMLSGISELFNLEIKQLQIDYINNRIEEEFGRNPHIIDSLEKYIRNYKRK